MVPYVLGHMFRCRPLRPDQIFQQDPVHEKAIYILHSVLIAVIQHDNENDKNTMGLYKETPGIEFIC